MTPYQLNRDLGLIIGRKPAAATERVVNFDLDTDKGYLSVLIEKTRTERRGRREITHSTRVLRVWRREGTAWTLSDSVSGPEKDTVTLAFEAPTASEQRERQLRHALGRPYDRDGYRKAFGTAS